MQTINKIKILNFPWNKIHTFYSWEKVNPENNFRNHQTNAPLVALNHDLNSPTR